MGILNMSETNTTSQQGQGLEINSHTVEQNTPSFFVKLEVLYTLTEQPTTKPYKSQSIPVLTLKR
jgi:hypothetical protein